MFAGHAQVGQQLRLVDGVEVLDALDLDDDGVFRIKHWVGRNNVKLYDKLGRILRAETTINDPRGIGVFRAAQGASTPEKAWRPMRKGVADIRRRTQVSQAANDRYLDALAAADTSQTLGDLLKSVTRRGAFGGRPVRGLRPWSAEDVALMSAIADGASCLRGFSNRDIRQRLYGPPNTKDLARRQGAKVSRFLRLLRGRGQPDCSFFAHYNDQRSCSIIV